MAHAADPPSPLHQDLGGDSELQPVRPTRLCPQKKLASGCVIIVAGGVMGMIYFCTLDSFSTQRLTANRGMDPPRHGHRFGKFIFAPRPMHSSNVKVGTKADPLGHRATVTSMSAQQKGREPWDFKRWRQQAGFFGAFRPRIPVVSDVVGGIRQRISSQGAFMPNDVIWGKTGGGPDEVRWGPLDDVIMGGASKSDFEPGESFTGSWKGTIVTQGGGFAGIRTKAFKVPFDLSNCKGFVLKVKGDGQRYKFGVRDDYDWNGVLFSYGFDTTADKTETIEIPFSDLIANRYARAIPNRNVNSKSITVMQLVLSKFELDEELNPAFREGPFQFELESISAM